MMLKYSAEVIGLLSLVLLCVAAPLAAVGLGVGALVNAVRGRLGALRRPRAAQ
jgi:hypothetical protein